MNPAEARKEHKPWCEIHHNAAATSRCNCDNRDASAAYAFGYAERQIETAAVRGEMQALRVELSQARFEASQAGEFATLLAKQSEMTAQLARMHATG